jgi:hypothetical protein
MQLSIYEGNRYHSTWLIHALMLVNAGFAAITMFWWSGLAGVLTEPVNWAANYNIPSRPELFDYPYSLIWGLPIAGCALGWILHRLYNGRFARTVLILPLSYIFIIFVVYHAIPVELR